MFFLLEEITYIEFSAIFVGSKDVSVSIFIFVIVCNSVMIYTENFRF